MEIVAHSDFIMSAVSRSALVPDGTAVEGMIRQSWERCLTEYKLEPNRLQRKLIYSSAELRDIKGTVEDLLEIAVPEIDRLYLQLSEHNYVISLTDERGIIIHLRHDPSMDQDCRQAGVLPGANWSEEVQGTNGIGTCIRVERAISVVGADHFSANYVDLSCTVAPIFGPDQRLIAILNLTTSKYSDRKTEALVRSIATRAARRIENRYFEMRHIGRMVVRLSSHSDFSDIAAEVRLALDNSGQVIDATKDALVMLSGNQLPLIGRSMPGFEGLISDRLLHGTRPNSLFEWNGARLLARLTESSPVGRRDVGRVPVIKTSSQFRETDPTLLQQLTLAQRLVDRSLPILVAGETGTGKSMLAKALHKDSVHRDGAFIALNCAAIPAELIESELFGYRAGAFTGASKTGARGRIAEADGGMLFLDEIGDMPVQLQTRLLQVLSEGEFVPLGATQPIKVRFALVSASLQNIPSLIEQGRFRQDLYYRINGSTIQLPALRDRRDKQALITKLIEDEGSRSGFSGMTIDPVVMRILLAHDWPGNVREALHVARYMTALTDDGLLTVGSLPAYLNPVNPDQENFDGDQERSLTELTLQQNHWNVTIAARRLGISRATLHRRIQAFGLKRPLI